MTYKISKAGLDLIKEFEGLRLEAYRCSANVLTIGYGSTRGVKAGDKITMAEADRRLREDLRDAEAQVNRFLKVPVTTAQYSALVSLVFNCGSAPLRGTLGKKLNAGDYDEACRQFDRWVNAGGKKIVGLQRRRDAEQVLWRSGGSKVAFVSPSVEVTETEAPSMMSSRTVAGSGVALLAGGGAVADKAVEIADRNSDRLIDVLFSTQSIGIWCGVIAALAIGYVVYRYSVDRKERV